MQNWCAISSLIHPEYTPSTSFISEWELLLMPFMQFELKINDGLPCSCFSFIGFHVSFLFLFPPAEQNTFKEDKSFKGYPVPVETLFSLFLKILSNCHLDNSGILSIRILLNNIFL